MENKVKLIPEEIDMNMKRLDEAIAIARIDNQAPLDEEFLEVMRKRAIGELNHEDVIDWIYAKHNINGND